jgi:phosphatidylglycerol---prolipoprotein diacylglyceryl transferase
VHPILFTLPNGFAIHVYGFLIALGTVLAVGIASRWGVKDGLDKDLFTDIGFWAILAGVVGARAEYIRVNRHQFDSIQQMINVRDGGLVYYGALLAVLFTFGIIIWRKKLPPLKVLDVMAPMIPFGIIFGRLGCYFAGCCYGDATDVAWAITFPPIEGIPAPSGIPLHPTQLYEVGYGALLFGGLFWMRQHKRFDGQLILTFLTVYPILRSINELFRGDPGRGWFWEDVLGQTLSNAQFISILVAIAAGSGWAWLFNRTR